MKVPKLEPDLDSFSSQLFEESKRFLEKAKESLKKGHEDASSAYCHACVLVGFASLEAHINAVAEELAGPGYKLTLHERALLLERDVILKKGRHELGKGLKMYRLIDRMLFICQKFASEDKLDGAVWIGQLNHSIEIRNRLAHPKTGARIDVKSAEIVCLSILAAIGAMYLIVYRKKFPASGRHLDSKLNF